MNYNDFRKRKAIEKANKEKWLKVNPLLNEESGIYILTRVDEQGFKYAYVGQAKHILTRLAEHLVGYQHIDLSLKKHKLYNEEKNIYGWRVVFVNYSIEELDEQEQRYIKLYAESGYQLRNKTSGSQGVGKTGIAENKPSKGYYDGVKQGKKKEREYIATMFSKYLDFMVKSNSKLCERKLQEFKDYLQGGNDD